MCEHSASGGGSDGGGGGGGPDRHNELLNRLHRVNSVISRLNKKLQTIEINSSPSHEQGQDKIKNEVIFAGNYVPSGGRSPTSRLSPSSPCSSSSLGRVVEASNVLSANIWDQCHKILDSIIPEANDFSRPVAELWPALTDYHIIIKKPMDLGTIKSKLQGQRYRNPREFRSDVQLTFENAKTYNQKGSVYHSLANTLLNRFNKRFKKVEAMLDEIDEEEFRPTPRRPPPAPRRATKVEVPEVSYPAVDDYVPSGDGEYVEAMEYVAAVEPEEPASPGWLPEEEKVYRRPSPKKHNPTPRPVPAPRPTAPIPAPRPTAPVQVPTATERAFVRGQTNKRLNRRANPDSYGGYGPLKPTQKRKIAENIHTLPDDRLKKLLEILEDGPCAHMVVDGDTIDMDVEELDIKTGNDIYRLVMNWQKSRKKRRVEKEMREQLHNPPMIEVDQDLEMRDADVKPEFGTENNDEQENDTSDDESGSDSDTSDGSDTSSDSDSDDDEKPEKPADEKQEVNVDD